jgi:ABC-type antimicrobial peptide transport system permease subunit
MRSVLTALGVIIGVGAVIAMTEIGEGSKAAIEKTIASMGAHKVPIFPAAVNNGGVSQGAGTFQTLRPSDVDEIARQCPAVSVVVPIVWARAQVVYGKRNWSPQQLTGTSPGYLATRDWEDLEEGECFTDADVRSSNSVCLIGATVKRELFEDESPIGRIIRIRNVPFRVVGLLSSRGANMVGQDQDDCILAPWTTIKSRVNGFGAGSTQAAAATASTSTINSLNNPYNPPTPLYPQASAAQLADTPQPARQLSIDMIQAKAETTEQVPVAIEQIAALLRERHHLVEDADDDFKILNMTEITRASARTAELMGALLLVVAAISLVVGGVGIMNIMLVSVTERTREIGLRMAVGARRHHILRQFLLEAFLLCLAGGALGILAGRGTSILVRKIQHWTTEISIPAIVISVVVAAGVGIVFGFYPAWKASRLDPIEALRHE